MSAVITILASFLTVVLFNQDRTARLSYIPTSNEPVNMGEPQFTEYRLYQMLSVRLPAFRSWHNIELKDGIHA